MEDVGSIELGNNEAWTELRFMLADELTIVTW
jgi:hypothetical protein